ncbi:MAG: hypothetical protein Q9166_007810 [cf. Caloplaca sp. 2 TL-2023]
MSAAESTKKAAAEDASSRRWKVAFAVVAGAALIGVTGGLAAPLVAAGVGTVMGELGIGIPLIGGYLGALAGSSGGKMTGRMMHQYAREVQDFSFVPVHALAGSKLEHRIFCPSLKISTLMKLDTSMNAVLKSYIWTAAKFGLAKLTIFDTLIAGLWPLELLQEARVLDNLFNVAKARSHKAWHVLVEALLWKVQGERPVVLVGYSLGARVIYHCHSALVEQNAFGLVESVVLISGPVPSDERHLMGRTLREIGFEDVDILEVEKEAEALRQSEETEKPKEEELQAQGDKEAAPLKAVIDEENAKVREAMQKHTAPQGRKKQAVMTPEASDSEADDGGRIALLDLMEDDIPRSSEKQLHPENDEPDELKILAPESGPDLEGTKDLETWYAEVCRHVLPLLL